MKALSFIWSMIMLGMMLVGGALAMIYDNWLAGGIWLVLMAIVTYCGYAVIDSIGRAP